MSCNDGSIGSTVGSPSTDPLLLSVADELRQLDRPLADDAADVIASMLATPAATGRTDHRATETETINPSICPKSAVFLPLAVAQERG